MPYFPLRTSSINWIHCGSDRRCVPCWTMRSYFLAASTSLRPSKMLWLQGFSTYTSLPAWHAQMAISECQWLGVTMETASRFLSSSAWRMSCTQRACCPPSPSRSCFGRQTAGYRDRRGRRSRHPSSGRIPSGALCPRPLIPATAMRTRSLAPSTRPEALVPADGERRSAPPATVRFRKSRRLCGTCVASWEGHRSDSVTANIGTCVSLARCSHGLRRRRGHATPTSSTTHGLRYSRLKSSMASGSSRICSVFGSICSFRPPSRQLMLA